MRKLVLSATAILAITLFVASTAVADRDAIVRFATLPPHQPGNPEGIAADPAGNIYAASFDFSGNNVIYVFSRAGHLADTIPLGGHVPLGMQWGPDGKLYVADFGNGSVLQLAPPSHAVMRTYAICAAEAHATPSTCGLNAIAFKGGVLYASDSFGGRIFTLDTTSGASAPWITDDELRPGAHGFPPFGANGLAFDTDGNLYVANTADDRILKITAAKVITHFTESINGADGIAFDTAGRLWVCANQENVLYVLNAAGRVVDIRGSFDGVGKDGAPRGLLFPASIVQSRGSMYVTNTALGFRHFFVDEPAGGPTVFTISRVPLGKDRGGD